MLGKHYGEYQESRLKIYQYFCDKMRTEGSIMKSADLGYMQLYRFDLPLLKYNYKNLFSSIIEKLKKQHLVSVQTRAYAPNIYTIIKPVENPELIIGTAEDVNESMDFAETYAANKRKLFELTRAAALIMRPGNTIQVNILVDSLDLPYISDSSMRGMYYNYVAGYFRNKARQGYFTIAEIPDGKLSYTRTEKPW